MSDLFKALYEIRGHLRRANEQTMYGNEMDESIQAALKCADAAIQSAAGESPTVTAFLSGQAKRGDLRRKLKRVKPLKEE